MELLLSSLPGVSVALLGYGAYYALQARKQQAGRELKALLQKSQSLPGSKPLEAAAKIIQVKAPQTEEEQALEQLKTKALQAEQDTAFSENKKNSPKNSILKRKHKQESFRAKLELKLERANLLLRFEEAVVVCVAFGVLVTLLLGFALGLPWPLVIVLGLPSMGLPLVLVNLKSWWRLRTAGRQFPEVLDTMVSCFKTGYGFNRAVQQVTENFKDPWGTEFGKMALETSLGATLEDSLMNLAKRLPSNDLDLFVTCIMIQKETGGNMTEMLNNLSHTCRDRFKLKNKVGAISAQGKLTAVIVCLVPVVIMAFMYLFMRDAVTEFLSNIIGQIVIGCALFWMALGAVVLWKMVQIEV